VFYLDELKKKATSVSEDEDLSVGELNMDEIDYIEAYLQVIFFTFCF